MKKTLTSLLILVSFSSFAGVESQDQNITCDIQEAKNYLFQARDAISSINSETLLSEATEIVDIAQNYSCKAVRLCQGRKGGLNWTLEYPCEQSFSFSSEYILQVKRMLKKQYRKAVNVLRGEYCELRYGTPNSSVSDEKHNTNKNICEFLIKREIRKDLKWADSAWGRLKVNQKDGRDLIIEY